MILDKLKQWDGLHPSSFEKARPTNLSESEPADSPPAPISPLQIRIQEVIIGMLQEGNDQD